MTVVSSRARRGFSIIELLTAIGILALLIALLIPVTSKVREMARRTQCASGLRQMVQATISYAGDNSGFLPQPNNIDVEVAVTPPPVGWLYQPMLTAPVNPTQADAQAETGSLWGYLKNHGVYHCPDDSDRPYPANQFSHYLSSYIMNAAVTGFYGRAGSTHQRTYAYELRRMPPLGVLFWEGGEDEAGSSAGSPWNDGSSYPNEGLSSRHSGGSQVALLNGSVEWLSQAQIQREVAKTPGRFWCNPASTNGQ